MEAWIPQARTALPKIDFTSRYLFDLWTNRHLTQNDEMEQLFLQQLSKGLEREAMLVADGDAVLTTILKAADVKGEVIVSPFARRTGVGAVERAGSEAVFLPMEGLVMTAEEVAAYINENTVAVVAAHQYGQRCPVEQLAELCKSRGVLLIVDTTDALLQNVHGTGDVSFCQLKQTKLLHSVRGSFVSWDAERIEKLGEELLSLRKFGEFHAAMGLCNWPHVAEWQKRREEIVQQYQEALADLQHVSLFALDYATSGFPMRTAHRQELMQFLHSHKIQAKALFASNHLYGNELVFLPVFPELTDEDVVRICDAMKLFDSVVKI